MILLLAALSDVVLAHEVSVGVDRWDVRTGLPQNTVSAMVEDGDGFLWLATFGGIVRFDGLAFTVFDPAGTPDLPSDRFLAVTLAADGTLWFGSDGGGLVRYREGHFDQVAAGTLEEVHALLTDGDRLWTAGRSGVHRLVDGQVETVLREPAFTLSEVDGGLWAGTDAGLVCVRQPCLRALDGNHASAVLDDASGPVVWVEDRYEQLRDGVWETLVGAGVDGPAIRWGDELWGQVEGDLVQLQGQRHLPLAGKTRAFYEDHEGGLWTGYDTVGLARYRRLGVERLSEHAIGVTSRPDGSLVSWSCEGSVALSGAPLEGWVDRACGTGRWMDGELWFAGAVDHVRGLYHVVDGTPVQVQEAELVEVFDGWAVVEEVVHRVEGARLHPVPSPPGVRGIRGDVEGLWATDGRSLLHFGPSGIERSLSAPPPNMPVRDVLPTASGLWVSTYGGGLHWIGDDGDRRALTVADGLCDNALSRLLAPGDGTVWVNTNRGAGRLHLEELEDWRQGRVPHVLCELVDSGEANGPQGVWTGERLVLPTIAGAVAIDPSKALPPPVAPRIHLEEAYCGERALGPGASLVGPCAFGVRWTSLSFDDPHGIRFRHRLLGVSEAWSDLSAAREVQHFDLPVGDYRFEVQARSARGVWSEVVGLSFRRAPEWWETPVGRMAPPVGIALLVLGTLLLRIRTERRQNELLRRQVEQRVRAEGIVRSEQEEKRRVLEQLEAARRLEAIGRLAGGVAHDFNNLLMVVRGRVEQMHHLGDAEIREEADLALEAADQAAELTSQLLAFGRRADNSPEVVDMSASIESMLGVLVRLCEPMRVSFDLAPDSRVRIDRTRLQQLVSNLCVNARDANASTLTLSTRRRTNQVLLEVADDGDGMPPEVVERVFEPYFTTKTASRGTGLGMATVHGVVEEAGGTIEVRSEIALGTTVTIALPRQAAPLSRPRRRRKTAGRLDSLDVLLVDDDVGVRGTVAAQLEILGAAVTTAGSGQEALAALDEAVPHVLITDVLMPGLSGPELVEAVKERGIEVAFLFISGHTGESLGLAGNMLRKPFSVDALAVAVLEAVGRPTPDITRRRDAT